MKCLNIQSWDKWQTYRKDRGTPPWIKVHRNLMTNPDWAILTDSQKGQLVSIWLVAADKNGTIPHDPVIIKKICQLDTEPDVNKFIDLGFLTPSWQPDDNQMTTTWQPDDAPETETETETEYKHCVDPNGSPRATGMDFERFWEHWPIKRRKKTARGIFMRKNFETEDVDLLIADVSARLKNDSRWKQGYIPNCPTYLNGHLWEDEYGN